MNGPQALPREYPVLPLQDAARAQVHANLARHVARMGVPVHMAYVVMRNAEVTRAQELEHLATLSTTHALAPEAVRKDHLRVQVGACTVKWERHAHYSCYTLLRALPPSTQLIDDPQGLMAQLLPEGNWLKQLPGQTLAAVHLVMLLGDPPHAVQRMAAYDHWFREGAALASILGRSSHSCAVSDFALQSDGFERVLLVVRPGLSEGQVGRVAQRVLDVLTHRVLAMQGLALARELNSELQQVEQTLANQLQAMAQDHRGVRQALRELAQCVRQTQAWQAAHAPAFAAGRAHGEVLTQRLAELREAPVAQTQALGEGLLRQVLPAMQEQAACERRLDALARALDAALALAHAQLLTLGLEQGALEHAQAQIRADRALAELQALRSALFALLAGLFAAALVGILRHFALRALGASADFAVDVASALALPAVAALAWHALRRAFSARAQGAGP